MDELIGAFPQLGIFSGKDIKSTNEKLQHAGIESGASQYLSFSLIFCAVLAFLFFFALLLFLDLPMSFASSMLFFSLLFLFFVKLPGILGKRRGKAIEADLPVALRSIAAELGMGVSFEKCLAHASVSQFAIAAELSKAQREAKAGASIPDALMGISSRVDSILVKRAIQQMIETYRLGLGSSGLRYLADELIEQQKAVSREYNAKIAFLGLLFVAVSCVVPALFQAYAIVGSSFLSSSLSPQDIWLIFLIGFPGANALVLLAIYERTPKIFSKRKEGILSSKQMLLAAKALKANGISYPLKAILVWLLALSTFSCIIALLLSFAMHFEPWLALLPFIFPVLAYFLAMRLIEQRNSELEERLPDALLHASSFPKGTPIEKIIHSVSLAGHGPLSEEFTIAYAQIASGSDVPSSLRALSEENDSVLLSRATGLLIQAYSSGSDMQRAMKETAEDMFSIFSIVRERESLLALQKYTLLFGGAIIVPLVLGGIASTVSGLSSTGLDFISSTSPEERMALFNASVGAAQAYTVIYSLLASLFIAQLGGSFRFFAQYFIVMAPLSLACYSLALNSNILSLA
jgi:Flp pilus assembly protein TadB